MADVAPKAAVGVLALEDPGDELAAVKGWVGVGGWEVGGWVERWVGWGGVGT